MSASRHQEGSGGAITLTNVPHEELCVGQSKRLSNGKMLERKVASRRRDRNSHCGWAWQKFISWHCDGWLQPIREYDRSGHGSSYYWTITYGCSFTQSPYFGWSPLPIHRTSSSHSGTLPHSLHNIQHRQCSRRCVWPAKQSLSTALSVSRKTLPHPRGGFGEVSLFVPLDSSSFPLCSSSLVRSCGVRTS